LCLESVWWRLEQAVGAVLAVGAGVIAVEL
jgi:hypothetical protein